MIIGISGKAGSGKDTVYNMIAEALNVTVMNQKFSKPLKTYAATLLDVKREQFEDQEFKATIIPNSNPPLTYREFLLEFGTTLMRRVDENYWTKRGMRQIDPSYVNVFTDMRFPNEMNAIKEVGGITIRVNMVGNKGVDHISDTALDDAYHDYTFTAEEGDIQGLKEQVAKFLENHGLIIAAI